MNTTQIPTYQNQPQKHKVQVHFLDTAYMRLLSVVNDQLYNSIKKALTDPSTPPAERFYYKIMLRRGIWQYGH